MKLQAVNVASISLAIVRARQKDTKNKLLCDSRETQHQLAYAFCEKEITNRVIKTRQHLDKCQETLWSCFYVVKLPPII